MSYDKCYKRKKSFIDDPEWVPKDKGTNDTIISSNSDLHDESKITPWSIHPRTAKKCLDYREKTLSDISSICTNLFGDDTSDFSVISISSGTSSGFSDDYSDSSTESEFSFTQTKRRRFAHTKVSIIHCDSLQLIPKKLRKRKIKRSDLNRKKTKRHNMYGAYNN